MCNILQDKLKNSFAFYSAYHRNIYNKLIHIITIPIIMWTTFVFLDYMVIYKYKTTDKYMSDVFTITASLVVILIYMTIYFVLDWIASLIMMPIIFISYITANLFVFNFAYAWVVALIIHILAWMLQFVGHCVFEKRRPALLDNLFQAFLMAPLFVLIEIMFMCGLRKDLEFEIKCIAEEYRIIR